MSSVKFSSLIIFVSHHKTTNCSCGIAWPGRRVLVPNIHCREPCAMLLPPNFLKYDSSPNKIKDVMSGTCSTQGRYTPFQSEYLTKRDCFTHRLRVGRDNIKMDLNSDESCRYKCGSSGYGPMICFCEHGYEHFEIHEIRCHYFTRVHKLRWNSDLNFSTAH
jgi:hypothetical protein